MNDVVGEVGLGSLHVLGLVEVGRADGLLHQDAFTDFLEDAILNIFINTFVHAQVIKTGNKKTTTYDVNLIKYSNKIKVTPYYKNSMELYLKKWFKLTHLSRKFKA